MQTDFLASFANRAFLKCLQIIQLTAHNAPAARFGGKLTQGEQNAAVLIDQEYANPDPGMATCRGAAVGGRWSLLFTRPFDFRNVRSGR
jgi:hypothetical protein